MLTSLGSTLCEPLISVPLPQLFHHPKNSFRFGHVESSRDLMTPLFFKTFCSSNNCLLETPSNQNAFTGKLLPGLLAGSCFSAWWLPLNVCSQSPFQLTVVERTTPTRMQAQHASCRPTCCAQYPLSYCILEMPVIAEGKMKFRSCKIIHKEREKNNIDSLRGFPSAIK